MSLTSSHSTCSPPRLGFLRGGQTCPLRGWVGALPRSSWFSHSIDSIETIACLSLLTTRRLWMSKNLPIRRSTSVLHCSEPSEVPVLLHPRRKTHLNWQWHARWRVCVPIREHQLIKQLVRATQTDNESHLPRNTEVCRHTCIVFGAYQHDHRLA